MITPLAFSVVMPSIALWLSASRGVSRIGALGDPPAR
jgi:hypothetical protein